MDATLDHIRDVESKFVTDEEIYQLRRKITLPQARQPELVDIGNGFFGFFGFFLVAIFKQCHQQNPSLTSTAKIVVDCTMQSKI